VPQTATDLFLTLAERMKLTDEQKHTAAELILLNPDLLVAQCKSSDALSAEAEQYSKDGNQLVAENRFASAVKLALYEGKVEAAKRHLDSCVKLDQTHNAAYRSALRNFESISECVVEFYKTKSSGVSVP
jgi:hypothetical protein